MKSPVAPKFVQTNLGAFSETVTMEIESSPKVFDLIFDKVYSHKGRAVVRETLTNAEDSHRQAGKMSTPVDVHLPSQLEPWFSVRDYGVSMSHDEVVRVFARPFSSTKDQSNEVTGMMGIGSKAGFAVSDTFTVETFKDGVSRMYICSRGADRVPVITTIPERFEIPTDEADGVLYSIPVSQDRIREFCDEATHLAWGFDVPLKGIPSGEYEERLSGATASGYRWRVVSKGHSSGHQLDAYNVRQGPVIYPVEMRELNLSKLTDLRYDSALVIDIPLGTADVGPDRESLSYDQTTKANLVNVFTEVDRDIWGKLDAIIQSSPTWGSVQKIVTAYSETFSVPRKWQSFFTQFSRKYVAQERTRKVPLFKEGKKYGADLFVPAEADHHPASKDKGAPVWSFGLYGFSGTNRQSFIYVTRPGIVREVKRIRAHWTSVNPHRYSSGKMLVLNDPSLKELQRVMEVTGISADRVISVAGIPDPEPPAPRGMFGGQERAPRTKRVSGVFDMRDIDRSGVEKLPEDYLWVRLENRRGDLLLSVFPALSSRTTSLGDLVPSNYSSAEVVESNDGTLALTRRMVTANSVRFDGPSEADLTLMGLPTAILGMTPKAIEKISPDPARELSMALAAQVDHDLVRRIMDYRTFEDLRAKLSADSHSRVDHSVLLAMGLSDEFDWVNEDGTPVAEWSSWLEHSLFKYHNRIYLSETDLQHYLDIYTRWVEKYPVLFARWPETEAVLDYVNHINTKES